MRGCYYYKWLYVACIAAVVWSCKKAESDNMNIDDKVNFSITAEVQNEIATYASDQGGLANINKNLYDQRYILEVYEGDKRVYHEIKTTEIGESASFNVRLLAKKYTFALWADFTPNKSPEDNLYNTTNGLAHVTYNENIDLHELSNDYADAYCYVQDIDLKTSGTSIRNTKLKRPLGKIRFVATDPSNGTPPVVSKIIFTEKYIPSTYNVLTGEISGSFASNELYFEAVPETTWVNGSEKEGYLLGNIYLFAREKETTYRINIASFSDNEMRTKIGEHTSDLPVKMNKLTTVTGNFFD